MVAREDACMSTMNTLLVIWLATAWVMTAGWAWQRRRNNAGIVDVLWSAGVGGSAVLAALIGAGAPGTRVVMAVLGGLWGLRLALHLWHRVAGEAEDGRYRALRAHWRGSQLKFFGFFQFQAFLVGVFAVPFLAVAANPIVSTTAIGFAVAIWLLSVGGESLADRQLAAFRADPGNHGKTCRTGFWRYSRHPNYFFEWLHWFAYVVLAIGSPLWWLAWSGPLVMFLFLRFVSGVPYTETQALRSRGEAYRRYQRDTPMFFPWFPKHESDNA
jgi:steroid 5-alpha reductase family enzyme